MQQVDFVLLIKLYYIHIFKRAIDMFGFRSDGIKLKNIDPTVRLTSYIMKTRNDAQVEMEKSVNCSGIDNFIKQEFERGNKFSYMHVVIAAIVRMYALRPKTNRFIMAGRVYSRRNIHISFTIKKRLDDEAPDTTIKLVFTGHESIYDVKEAMDNAIKKSSVITQDTKTDKLAKKLLNLPHFILSPFVGFIKLLDRFGIMPKAIIDASPFHTSCYLTNLKSLGTEHVFHHIYNFGTTGIFVAMGKEKNEAVVNRDGQLAAAKIMRLGVVIDERVCDGFYYARSLKTFVKHAENPNSLTERLSEVVVDSDLKTSQLNKQKRKENKLVKKQNRKLKKAKKAQQKKIRSKKNKQK